MNSSYPSSVHELKIVIKGAGDMATGVAVRLYRSNLRRLILLETPAPQAIRRLVAMSEAVNLGKTQVEGIQAVCIDSAGSIEPLWAQGRVPVLVDPEAEIVASLRPHVLIDATLTKRNQGMHKNLAPLTIALGPGFEAGKDAHLVIETKRGHDLGRVIEKGRAAPNTGTPGNVAGETVRRVLRSPAEGRLRNALEIGSSVTAGQRLAEIDGVQVQARIDGVLRGMLPNGIRVTKGMKIGDVDPRGDAAYCSTISDKARAVGGAVLEGILSVFNRPL